MDKTEFPWDYSAADIVGVAVNFDPQHIVDAKRNFGKRRCYFSRQSLINVLLVDPVTNFAYAFAKTRVQTTPPEYLRLITAKDAINKILAKIELATAAP
jgi:hypothetical protein